MARPLRLQYAGALHHAAFRGDGQEEIYRDNKDRENFLAVLLAVKERFDWTFHAYCLMSNHYHRLTETPDANLSMGMRQLNGVYTQRFQSKDRDTAIRVAYSSGGYTLKELGDYFDLRYSTVSRIVSYAKSKT